MKGVIAVTLLLLAALLAYLHTSQRFAYMNGLLYRSLGWDEQSAVMFETGCAAKNVRSCVELGAMYEEGRGVRADPDEAIRLYRRAAELGYLPAQHRLETLEQGR